MKRLALASLENGSKRVAIKGDLKSFGPADIISFIEINRKTGILTFDFGRVSKSLFLREGNIIFASSSLKEDRLGESLCRAGKISPEHLEVAAKEISPEKNLGKILVEKGFITAKELWLGLRRQVEEIVYSIFYYKEGSFSFLEGDLSQGNVISLNMSTQNLMMEGIRRIDEWARFLEKFPSKDIVLEPKESPPNIELNPIEQRALSLVDGSITLEEISRRSGLGDFDTYKVLFHLIQAGFVEIRQEGKASRAISDIGQARLEPAVEEINTIFKDIYSILHTKTKDIDFIARFNTFFLDLPPDLSQLFKGVKFDEEGGLNTSVLIQNTEGLKREDKKDFLIEALNELLYFLLFELRNLLEKEEAEELAEIIQKMQID